MATLFEQSTNYNTRCFACGSLVYAVEKKLTTNHVYHNRCFRCRICKRNLTGFSLNEDGDDIYCGNCYRRKQRGDCDSFEFHRAAAEKAQFVHYRHHPDQINSLTNSRPPSLRDVTRHPSLTLRQLERQFLSHEPDNNHNQTRNETNQRSFSLSHPMIINTNFSTPIDLTKITKNESSPQFSPVFSPFPTIRTETIITPNVTSKSTETTDEQIKSTTNTIGGIEFRLNKSHIDLTNITSPRTNRKNIIIPDLNPNDQSKERKFCFPDLNISSIRRRSRSANHFRNSLRVD